MKDNTMFLRIKEEGRAFCKAASRANETAYLILLSLYVTIYFLLKFGWAAGTEKADQFIRYSLLGIVMWGAAVYLLFVFAEWRSLWDRKILLLAAAAVILSGTWFFSRHMSTNSYGVVMDIFFCLMACGKDYRKMLRCILTVGVIMLIIAGLGLPLGYTWDMVKPKNVSPGHSLGINYPNTWGYLAFLAMMTAWYLFLRFKPVPTFALFWAVTVFMYKYISCRTISLLAAVFPVLACAVDLLERWADRKEKASPGSSGKPSLPVTLMPFWMFAFMMIVSRQYKWMHRHFYHGPLHNFAMRFVQAGLYFKSYGLPVVGNPYSSSRMTYVNVNGEFLEVGILDSSFASYIIMRGILWLFYTLAWLCLAIRKALKNRDYAIPFLEFIILIFAMMERPGLEMWYNFVMLYPLAKVSAKAVSQKEEAPDTVPEAAEENAGGAVE